MGQRRLTPETKARNDMIGRSLISKSKTPARNKGASGSTVGGKGIDKPPKKR